MLEATGSELLDGYYPKHKTAEKLNVSPRTLDAWHLRREGPPRTKVAGRVYYRIEALERWLREQEECPVRSRACRDTGRTPQW